VHEVTLSVLIDRPPEVVFAYVTDPQATREWNPDVLSVRVEPPGPITTGTRIIQRVRAPLRTIEGTYEVVAYEPGRQAVYRLDASFMTEEVTMRVDSEGSGTRHTLYVKGAFKGAWRFLEPLTRTFGPRRRQRMLDHIKRRLEATSTLPSD
jgi:uncharacterized protein YndB with AHSA1/START domain